jgi:hypothetical protein
MKTNLAVLVGILLVGIAGLAFAAEQSVPAQVTVNSHASVTITPCASTLNFGSGDPGDTDLPVDCQNATDGAITVTNDDVSNQNINVETKGTDFASGENSIAVSNLEFDEDNNKSSPTTLSTAYQTSSSNIASGSSAKIWYWLDIPAGQTAGTYSGTISVRGQ